MSTLIVTLDHGPAYTGGVASWAEDLARALSARGERVEVLAQHNGDTSGYDRALPYPIHRMRGRSWASWQGLWAALGGLPRLSGLEGGRIVFATWQLAPWLAPAAGRAGVRVGLAFHGSDLSRLGSPGAGFRRALSAADALLPVSGFLAATLGRLGADAARVSVLPMPLVLPGQPGPRGEALLCVARLTPLKGVERAIRLAAKLGRPLWVVGEGPQRAQLEQAARGTATTFLGRMDRAAIQALPAAAAVLLPRPDADGSGAEGLGLTLIEAAARGLPTVGCRTGGVPEATGPGLVLQDPDSPSDGELAALEALIADPQAPARFMQWAARAHGPGPCLEVLDAALPPGGARA